MGEEARRAGLTAWAGVKNLVKKPLTAETAETAEKKSLRILGALCVLGGKTGIFSKKS
jgi:hypothetical protein